MHKLILNTDYRSDATFNWGQTKSHHGKNSQFSKFQQNFIRNNISPRIKS